jgi:hypothetical protein
MHNNVRDSGLFKHLTGLAYFDESYARTLGILHIKGAE